MKSPRIERRASVAQTAPWPDSVHPVLQRIYSARGISAPHEIEHRLASLLPPQSLDGMSRACELLEKALRDDAHIIIVGDFDADGATGTAVALRGLRMLGAHNVGYAVPNRFRHGYGLSPAIVEELVSRQPRLLITVDNGIAAHAGIAAAKARGMQVIVTDHHLPGATLPDADAIVNPNASTWKQGDDSALGGSRAPDGRLNNMAGVGVMFYLLLALRAHLRGRGWFAAAGIPEPDLSTLLDLVALGTVADLVPLDYNNRILVDAGLRRIRTGQACAGVAALIQAGRRDPARLIAADLGFIVAPRINAAGRLEDMGLGIECLLADDPGRARDLAETLSAINAERRELQAEMIEQAQAEVHKWTLSHGTEALPHGVVLFDPGWHHGVVGLVASRLKDVLHRPVFACAPGGEGSDEVKASGRSIPGFHLRDALAEIDARRPGLLRRFGGHAMAAGLTLQRGDVETFAGAFDAVVRERMAPEALDAILLTDGELDAGDYSLGLAQQLRYAGPWGQSFAEPLFDGEFAIVSWKVMGETHLRLKLQHAQMAQPLDAVMFNAYVGVAPPARLRAAFALDVNEWNGAQSLQLTIRHLEPA